MRFDTSQHMKLGQQMKLAPRMIQSMEILQMGALALQERIEQELESNVALEIAERSGDGEPDREAERDDRVGERELVVGGEGKAGEADWERLDRMERDNRDWSETTYSSSASRSRRDDGERDRKMDAMANVAARSESLAEQLQHQWTFAEVPVEVARAGDVIIEYVNADGLLSADLETILEQSRAIPGVELDLELLQRAVGEVQRWLEPAGVGARDLRECLLLQVDARERADDDLDHDWDTVRRLISSHFDDLIQNRVPKIAQETGLPLEALEEARGLMRRLTLSPGRDLVDERPPPILPDVIVEFDEELDRYVARLNRDITPPLRISSDYRKMAGDREQEKSTREFVQKNLQGAEWLIDAIRQRRTTLLRVVEVVLARQREFFDSGPRFLKPLPMTEVADLLDVSVGTVSRAVKDKWLLTPRGFVPLRRLFSGGTADDEGRDMSWEAVRETLRDIVEAEDRTHPFSDEQLVAELRRRGIEIARRTVVKYRQQLDIPAARLRKLHVTE